MCSADRTLSRSEIEHFFVSLFIFGTRAGWVASATSRAARYRAGSATSPLILFFGARRVQRTHSAPGMHGKAQDSQRSGVRATSVQHSGAKKTSTIEYFNVCALLGRVLAVPKEIFEVPLFFSSFSMATRCPLEGSWRYIFLIHKRRFPESRRDGAISPDQPGSFSHSSQPEKRSLLWRSSRQRVSPPPTRCCEQNTRTSRAPAINRYFLYRN